jgi:CubicO group peptidase (beta-lactamase class C family)
MRISVAAIVLASYVAVVSACGGPTAMVGPPEPPSPKPTLPPTSIDNIVQNNYSGDWGVELAIYKNGALAYEKGYGLRDRGLPDTFVNQNIWGIEQPDILFNMPRGQFKPDAATAFDLASVSKEFTAGAILLLQQDGRLSVNDPLSKYFPGIPSAPQITLLDLLNHTSGLVEYNNFGTYPDFTNAYAQFMAGGQTNYQPIVTALQTFPLLFTPGTQYNYSNTDYVLLGMIVAQVSGEPLGTFMQQRIFGPLGMTQTHQGYPAAPVTDLALGYAFDGVSIVRTWQWNLQWLAGPGGLTSTVGDIEKWDEAVRAPGIFTQTSLTQMFTPGAFPLPYGTYADGWFIATLDGHRYVWHDGAIGGFVTMNATFPDDDINIIVLVNDFTGTDPYYIIPQLFPIALAMNVASNRRH